MATRVTSKSKSKPQTSTRAAGQPRGESARPTGIKPVVSKRGDKAGASRSKPAAKISSGASGLAISFRAKIDPTLDPWPYAPAPETVKVDIRPHYGLFIGGQFVPSAGGDAAQFATLNPAAEQQLATLCQANGEDVDRAVQAARAALPKWRALRPAERGKYLFRIARRIQERARELAVLETLDGGKPIKESRDVDLPLVAQHFFYHAGWADKLAFAVPGAKLGADGQPEPVGVCGQIIPWNFPLMMAAWKLAPALACGNTCVLKPAETTSLTALRLAEILQEVDLPPGVVNIITGDGSTGKLLVEHPGVDKVAFTGSTEVGKRIAQAVAGTNKRLTLELGGKSANIIFEDASIDQAVEGIVQGIYFNQGHVCCAGSRLLVQEPVLDKVIRKLTLRLASLRVGDPMDKNTDVGAINSKAQLETIRGYVRIGSQEGAEYVEANACPLPGGGKRGFWHRPGFFTGVQPSHRIAREEIFGPVLSIMSFRTPEEALQRANNTPYGLAAGVWTEKGSKILRLAQKLEAGVVWLNTYNQFDPASPFGGVKESGFGREGGAHGLRGYLRV